MVSHLTSQDTVTEAGINPGLEFSGVVLSHLWHRTRHIFCIQNCVLISALFNPLNVCSWSEHESTSICTVVFLGLIHIFFNY